METGTFGPRCASAVSGVLSASMPSRMAGTDERGPLVIRRAVVVLASVIVLLATASPAHAAQHQNAYLYSNWSFSGSTVGYWNVDQLMRVEQKAAATYWAKLWTFRGATYGGYMGLQTDGSRGDGTTGETAIFSLWNANAASGPRCLTFGGEGVGYSCRLAYPFSLNTYYRLRVWRLNADAGGQWWGAWIQNTATGVDSHIGSIRVPSANTLLTGVRNFVEYFGPAVPCTSVPRSQAVWTQPAANSLGGGLYQYGSTYAGANKGACTDGSATPVSLGWTNGVRVVLGG